jgi:hypothetical protein
MQSRTFSAKNERWTKRYGKEIKWEVRSGYFTANADDHSVDELGPGHCKGFLWHGLEY